MEMDEVIAATADLDETPGVLRQRASSLRRIAGSMNEVVAQAYRRRAAELELQAWLTEIGKGQAHGPVAA